MAQCLVCSSINSCYNYYEILIKHALIKTDLLLSYQIYAVSLNIILQLAPGIWFNENKVTHHLNKEK